MKKLSIIACLVLLIALAGCKKYLDVNTNPNLSEEAPLNGLLSSTTYNTGVNVYNIGDITSYFVQYLASPNAASGTDTYDEVDYSDTWAVTDNNSGGVYNTLTDLYDMIRTADSLNAPQYAGIGKLLMALNLHLASDIWGAMPYKEALSGNYVQPRYDTDREIYDTCLSLIEQGIALLDRPDPSVILDPSRDLLYGGNMGAWKKMAYALKARLLNHLSKTGDYDPAKVLAALQQAFTSNNDDLQLARFQSLSFWNEAAVNNANQLLDGWLSEHFVDALDGTTFGLFDPRLPLITDTTKFGDYRGTRNGAGRVGTGTSREECYLSQRGFYSRPGAPLLIITYAECKFIEAEAAFRAGNRAAAYAAYLEGIQAHMQKTGVSAAAAAAYRNNPAVSVGAASLTLNLIMKEKYVAMFLNPEAWVDARRFDYRYQDFEMPENAVLNTFVRRVAYPNMEKNRNGANVPEVTMDERLWWDVE